MSHAITGLPSVGAGAGTTTTTSQLTDTPGDSDFMGTLRNAMDQIGELQTAADDKVTQLLTGNGQDVHSAMIAVEKAGLAFQMMVSVRNKIVQAYQQVSGIPF
jgi:flagellar hook-basal body complex protein FliE